MLLFNYLDQHHAKQQHLERMGGLQTRNVWFHTSPRMIFYLNPPIVMAFSLAAYFPPKVWLLRPPSCLEFSMTILGVGMDIF